MLLLVTKYIFIEILCSKSDIVRLSTIYRCIRFSLPYPRVMNDAKEKRVLNV